MSVFLCLLSRVCYTICVFVTIQSEKVRLYQWLLMTLSSGVRLTGRFETGAAAQEIENELRQHFADAVYQDRPAMAVNFATGCGDVSTTDQLKCPPKKNLPAH